MIYIILVVLVFGLLIMMHELGHFITAKLCGVRVNEFAIGMGPAIWKKQHGETLYALRIIPFGGYCAMEGEDGNNTESADSFQVKPVWQRILIVIAGPIMNLIVGVIVLACVFAPIEGWATPTLTKVDASVSQLQAGDRITKIDDYGVILSSDLYIGLERGQNKPNYTIEVERDGQKVVLQDVELALHKVVENGEETMRYGLTFAVERSSFWGKTRYVFQNAYNLVRLVKVGLVDLFTGRAGAKDLSGPIGIGTVMVNTAKQSMPSLWYLVALVSINLGVMNLLPLPALDGGRLLFFLIELVRRKPISPKYESWVHAAGFVLLMLLMVLVTFQDIVKLVTGG